MAIDLVEAENFEEIQDPTTREESITFWLT